MQWKISYGCLPVAVCGATSSGGIGRRWFSASPIQRVQLHGCTRMWRAHAWSTETAKQHWTTSGPLSRPIGRGMAATRGATRRFSSIIVRYSVDYSTRWKWSVGPTEGAVCFRYSSVAGFTSVQTANKRSRIVSPQRRSITAANRVRNILWEPRPNSRIFNGWRWQRADKNFYRNGAAVFLVRIPISHLRGQVNNVIWLLYHQRTSIHFVEDSFVRIAEAHWKQRMKVSLKKKLRVIGGNELFSQINFGNRKLMFCKNYVYQTFCIDFFCFVIKHWVFQFSN